MGGVKEGSLKRAFLAIPQVVTFDGCSHIDELIGELTGTETLAVRYEIAIMGRSDGCP